MWLCVEWSSSAALFRARVFGRIRKRCGIHVWMLVASHPGHYQVDGSDIEQAVFVFLSAVVVNLYSAYVPHPFMSDGMSHTIHPQLRAPQHGARASSRELGAVCQHGEAPEGTVRG